MVSEIWVPQSLAQVLPDLTSFWSRGKPIWGKWANNYDVAQLGSRQVHKTLNEVNPSSSFRDMRSAKSGPNLWQIWQVFGPWEAHMGQMGKWPWQCTTTGLDNSTELRMEKICQAVTEIWVLQVWQPPACPNRDDNIPPARRAEGLKNYLSFIIFKIIQHVILLALIPNCFIQWLT